MFEYHGSWQQNRINYVVNKFGKDFFLGKTILELGSYNGVIGNAFQEMGGLVTAVEGRTENVRNISQRFPHLKVINQNLDSPTWEYGHYDIIINWGLLYHLEFFSEEHLNNCLHNSNLCFLESVIFDSNEDMLNRVDENNKDDDQTLSDFGNYPTESWVENRIKKCNKTFEKVCDQSLNAKGHHYDWISKNSKILDRYSRRMWFIS